MKPYKQSPLPFQGQKRRFLKAFKQALKNFKPDATYVDLFGGSGLLSHIVKQHYPDARVIWNDYDNYVERLKAIPQTNVLLRAIRLLLKDVKRKERLSAVVKEQVLNGIEQHEEEHGYVDYITLSASLMFSAKYALNFKAMASETMYNRVRLSDYDAAGYLDGVERLQGDYKAVYERYKSNKTVYLVDPPYLSTDTSTYSKKTYWKLRDYLDVLSVLDGSGYFYFTSNKSQIIELCEWFETRTVVGNPFANATMSTTAVGLNKNAKYTDIMIYKPLNRD